MALHRREFCRSLPLVAAPVVSGCNSPEESPSSTLRVIRVINLSGRALSIELTASPESGTAEVLYSGTIGTQGPAAGDGEVVLQPSGITDPLQYDYRLQVAGAQRERLRSSTLEAASQRGSADSPGSCVELSFAIRDPADDAGVGSDYTFWESCETAPGTVDPTTDS